MAKKKFQSKFLVLIFIALALLYFLSEGSIIPSTQQSMVTEGYMDFTHYVCEDELCENEIGVPVYGFTIEEGELKEKDLYGEIYSSDHPLVMDQDEVDAYSGVYDLYHKISNLFQTQSIIRCTGDACETEQRKKIKEGEVCVLVPRCEETDKGFIDVLFCGKKDIKQIEDYCFGDELRQEANNYLLQSATPYAPGSQLQACNPSINGYVDCEQAEYQWYKGGSNPRWTNRKLQQAYTSSGNADLNKVTLDNGKVVFAPWELRTKVNSIECVGDKDYDWTWKSDGSGKYQKEIIRETCGPIKVNYNTYHYYSGDRQFYPSRDSIMQGGCGKLAMSPPSGDWVCCGKYACYGGSNLRSGIPGKLKIGATEKALLPQSDKGITYLYTVSRASLARFNSRTMVLLILRHHISSNIVDCVYDNDCPGDLACIEGQCMTQLWQSRESNIGFMDTFVLAPGESFEKEFILDVRDIKPETTSSFEFDVSAQNESAISKEFLLEFGNE